MYNTFSAPNYPYHGQPYHTYFPPGYPQQQPRPTFPSAQAPMSPSHTDSWSREMPISQPVGFPPQSNGHNLPFIPPETQAQAQTSGHPPRRRIKRSSSTKPQLSSEKPPLKSALKKNGVARSESVSAVPFQRTRTDSDARQRLAPMTRTRTNSNPSFLPGNCHIFLVCDITNFFAPDKDHMFVSFHGSNELRLGNVAYQDILDEIRERLLPMWPHGVPNEITANHSWRVIFSRNPWSATGLEALTIIQLFVTSCSFIPTLQYFEVLTVLAEQGYQYLTSLNTGYAYPQLIFKDVKHDEDCDFFVAYLSRSGHKITLIRPPRRIGEQLGSRLRNVWPYKIASDAASEEEIYTVELKRNAMGAYNLDRDVFVSHTLQEISLMGYKLEATIHLPRVGILGFGTRREIWVFRGPRIRSRANSRSGRA
ncbi:hypothetical protein V8B97DRAFT_1918140 [Scleroderma yunnanense]